MNVQPIVKVSFPTLYKFLASHEEANWKVIGPNAESGRLLNAVDIIPLLCELELYFDRADDQGYLYVFSNEFTVSEAVSEMANVDIPIINAPDKLRQYRVGSGRGHDYLYLSPCLDEAASDEYIILMMY